MALDAIQCLGGNGYINDYPTGRLLRDAKLYEIGAGTSEIRRMLIGRELLRSLGLNMRSLLVVPGGSAGTIEEALGSRPDALVFDLERGQPSLPPTGMRRARPSRRLLPGWPGPRTGLACSSGSAAWAWAWPTAISTPSCPGSAGRHPAAEHGGGHRCVAHLGAKLAVREAEHGWPDGSTAILALATGTARGVFGLGSLHGAGQRLAGIAWDGQALAADLGAAASLDRNLHGLVRGLTLLAAAAGGSRGDRRAFGRPRRPCGRLRRRGPRRLFGASWRCTPVRCR